MNDLLSFGFQCLGIAVAIIAFFWLLVKLVLISTAAAERLRLAVRDVRQKVSLLAGVLAAADEWAVAENALRERQADGDWVGARFSEEDHKHGLQADITEQNLLDAVRKAWSYNIDLGSYRRWK